MEGESGKDGGIKKIEDSRNWAADVVFCYEIRPSLGDKVTGKRTQRNR